MEMDKIAAKRIQELEADVDDLHIIVDLQREELAEKDGRIRVLQGQLQNLLIDRRYSVG